VAKDPDNPDRRVLAPTKNNLAKPSPALSFSLVTAGQSLKIEWTGDSVHTAESLLATPRDPEEKNAVDAAVDVLREILSGGPVHAKEARQKAKDAGVGDRTLDKAKVALGVRASLVGFGRDGQWRWALPESAQST
jgi:hypothetical protein